MAPQETIMLDSGAGLAAADTFVLERRRVGDTRVLHYRAKPGSRYSRRDSNSINGGLLLILLWVIRYKKLHGIGYKASQARCRRCRAKKRLEPVDRCQARY